MGSSSKAPGRRSAGGPKRLPAYGPAQRLLELRTFLDASDGATLKDIAGRFEVSTRTALRYLQALERAGDPVYEETHDRRKFWRLEAGAPRASIALTAAQMIALYLSRRVFDFLKDTGFKEDLDDVFERLKKSLRRKDFAAVENLEHKLYDMDEGSHDYQARGEDVSEIVEALLRQERLRVTHGSVSDWRTAFEIDPYSLLVWRKGLYVACYSHHREAIRTYSLDGFRDVERLKGQKFEYPRKFDVRQFDDGYFGLDRGEGTPVRLRFSKRVGRFVYRRKWHPTQKGRKLRDAYELRMKVHGMDALRSWILSFGDTVEVIEPESLRQQIKAELDRARARYDRTP